MKNHQLDNLQVLHSSGVLSSGQSPSQGQEALMMLYFSIPERVRHIVEPILSLFR